MEKSYSKRVPKRTMAQASFDVTCVVGTVVLDGYGEESPSVVAMKLIAEHDAPGTFSFPMADGRTERVTVEFVESAKEEGGDI